jgi:hypothetical protein
MRSRRTCGCCCFAVPLAFLIKSQRIVISTEATGSLIVCCAVEKPPHFAFAFAFAFAVALPLPCFWD